MFKQVQSGSRMYIKNTYIFIRRKKTKKNFFHEWNSLSLFIVVVDHWVKISRWRNLKCLKNLICKNVLEKMLKSKDAIKIISISLLCFKTEIVFYVFQSKFIDTIQIMYENSFNVSRISFFFVATLKYVSFFSVLPFKASTYFYISFFVFFWQLNFRWYEMKKKQK